MQKVVSGDLLKHGPFPGHELDYGELRKKTQKNIFFLFFRLQEKHVFRAPTLELDYGETRFAASRYAPRLCVRTPREVAFGLAPY